MRTIRFCLLLFAGIMAASGVQAKKKDILSQEKGKSITFRVDPDLPEPTGESLSFRMRETDKLISEILNQSEIRGENQRVVAWGIGDERYASYGKNPFFNGMIDAFADHRPVVLTPDVIWFLICQGFAHYVNDNPEELRHLFVDHEGKIDLIVQSGKDLLTEDADWEGIVNCFADQIRENTKGDIADIMAEPFSTTGVNEHMVSQIALMETCKSYFDYIVIYLSCGIPSVTLKGTPEDWQSILDRTRKLRAYGIDWWVDDLEPILEEFVKASKGKPNTEFWRSIVKKYRPGDVRGLGCGGIDMGATKFDGWFLKFLPYDEKGRTPDEVLMDHDMLPEMVRTEYKYIIFNDATGEVEKTVMMEFWAGIVGMEVDPETCAMTPKMGWFTRVGKTQEELLEEFKAKDSGDGYSDGLMLKVNKVPDIIRAMGSINRLSLHFVGKVDIPNWMDSMDIRSLEIYGSMTPDEEEALRKRFPKARINGQFPRNDDEDDDDFL